MNRGLVLPAFLGLMIVISYVVLLVPRASAQWEVDYIQIRSAPGGLGYVIGDMTYFVGDTDMFWAAGYNFTAGYITDIVAYWSSYNSSVGWVEPRTGTNTTFHASGEGETKVWAYMHDPPQNQTNIFNETGVLIVLYRGVDYLQIRDGPHGGGDIVTTRNYFVDDTDTYYAAGYNFSGNYVGDLPATWDSSDESVCTITKEGAHAAFKAVGPGICQVEAHYNATVSNMTGDLKVEERTVLTVDDDPGADYLTIHEAIENASDGYVIFVYNGTYEEHLLVDKQLLIKGESRDGVIVDGGGSGKVFHIVADKVEITRFTVKNAEYGFYLDHCNKTTITYNKVTSYAYGIYSNRTNDAFIAWNLITVGQYGVVTDHAHNDAVRWNEISYNDKYGAKDYDSDLKNCFNWNYFHHNHIAYYYDPDEPVGPTSFDGNRIEQNDVGIMAAYASQLIATNNTILNNGVGIDLIQSSPYFSDNILRENTIGIRFSDSSASIYRNQIEGGDYGIVGSGISPTFQENSVFGSRIAGITITSGDEVSLLNNDLNGGIAYIIDSTVRKMSLIRTTVRQVNSTALEWSLDVTSRIDVQWYLTVQVKDAGGNPAEGAFVRVLDESGAEVANGSTGVGGGAQPFILTGKIRRFSGDTNVAPYSIEATKGDMRATQSIVMDANKQMGLELGPLPGIDEGGIPWLFVGLVGFTGVLTVAGLFSIEVFAYFLFALFVPLYTKLRKDQVLDHYSRGRVYQFIEMNPGEHFNSIKRALDLNIGTATYHLEVLARSGLITSRQDGIYKRFYPTNIPIPPANGNGISEVQQRVFTIIKDSPGISQKELANIFGIRQSTLNYQVTKLEEKGLITAQKRGRKVHYFPKQLPPPP